MREFFTQRLEWSAPGPEGALEYAVVDAPVDYADPAGERIRLAISRSKATDPGRRRGVLVLLNGGPGGDGGLGRSLPERFARTPLNEVYDVIGFDPRGTGASTRLEGEATASAAPFTSRPADDAFEAITRDMRERDQGCMRAGGTLRRHVSTRNNARDLDLIRVLLGEDKINFVGWAYGTLLGAVYGTMFGRHLDRSVLDSCVHPDWDWRTQFKSQALAVRENVDAWAGWAAQRDGHFGLGRSAEGVLGFVERTAARLAETGPRDDALRTSFDIVVGALCAARPRWGELGYLVGELQQAAESGDAEKAQSLLAGQVPWRPGYAPGELREAVLEAVTCETPWPAELETYYRDMREFRERYPYGLGVMRAQPWVGTFRTFEPPEPQTRVERAEYPAGIVVQADGDPLDYHVGGAEMARRLEHCLVRVVDSGAHEIYAFGGNDAVDDLVNRYLIDGVLPPERIVDCPGAPRPAILPD